MENLNQVFSGFYRNKRVLVTGHTGFKGSWLAEWLHLMQAEVVGCSLDPPTNPSLFSQIGLQSRVEDHRLDIRDRESVAKLIRSCQPDLIFHLAAQPLVRESYLTPVETIEVNVLGTVNVMDALRGLEKPCAAVMVTTDKCYENREWLHGYREEDAMGGYDPYSASKGMAELAIAAYRRSFFQTPGKRGIALASARAGNVLGGGDWATDRIIPDCIRALSNGVPIVVRNKTSTRPWQHVLEPLGGYLLLGAKLFQAITATQPEWPGLQELAGSFNFGPPLASNKTVADLVRKALEVWPGSWVDQADPQAPHEASKLNLATDKAHHLLGWAPVWNFDETIRETIDWYREAHQEGASPLELTRSQIQHYCKQANTRVGWAQ